MSQLYARRLGPHQPQAERTTSFAYTLNAKRGFTLIEVLLFILVVLAMVTILLSTAGTFIRTRAVNLESVAARIASCEIERLRKLDFASLPSTGIVDPPCNADLSKLPDPKSATRTINDYLLDPDVKQVSIQVTWTESNVGKDVKIETLISKYGL